MLCQHAEYNYYKQIQNGDFYKKKMLNNAIEKIDQIREELKKEWIDVSGIGSFLHSELLEISRAVFAILNKVM